MARWGWCTRAEPSGHGGTRGDTGCGTAEKAEHSGGKVLQRKQEQEGRTSDGQNRPTAAGPQEVSIWYIIRQNKSEREAGSE